MKYKLKDISVIIPTYNRSSEISETLNCLKESKIREIIIIDQSTIDSEVKNIKELCESFSIPGVAIKYVHSDFPSTACARNKGLDCSDTHSKIICYLDDDVSVKKNYFETIISKFNNYPNLYGVAGFRYYPVSDLQYIFDLLFLTPFFLRNYDRDACRVLSPYSNTYPINLNKDIYAQWFPGFNTAYKKEILQKYKFDSNLGGYSLAEDLEFSYSLFLKNKEALLLTPDTLVEHRYSQIERANIKKISYINQVDHFYFYWKYRDSFSKTKHYWSILGIFLLRTLKMLDLKKDSALYWYYFILSLKYCLTNKEKIIKGDVRSCLNN